MRIFKKLIRDKIPEIMKKQERELEVRVLGDDKEFGDALLKKLVEETQEIRDAKNDAEIKDKIAYLYEIIDAVLRLHNFKKAEILEIQQKTRAIKGGFEKRLFLEGEKK